MTVKNEFERLRYSMVSEQIESRGIKTPQVLEAFRSVPRHAFVPEDLHDDAYGDFPLPIGQGQTISQPYIVALMTDLLQLEGGDTVLEVGTGSGYQAAILSQLVKTVHTIERHAPLAEKAREKLNQLGYDNVHIHVGDGTLGWAAAAPYDAIVVTAAAPSVPEPLKSQLADGGRMVIPVGARPNQELQVWKREGGSLRQESVLLVSFVPLRGEHGWQDTQWY